MLEMEYDKLVEIVDHLAEVTKIKYGVFKTRIGIICGSGLSDLANILENPETISYHDIPHFVGTTIEGHPGELVFGEKDGVGLVCMRGRVHLYEGHDVVDCIRPIRLMARIGVKILIITNAAGSLNESYNPGDFVVIKDHISFPSLAGQNPLRGRHDKRLGERFVTMSKTYDRRLIKKLKSVAEDLELDDTLRKGVYAMVEGPSFETTAEARALKTLGADTIGMSTVHEVIAARQMNVRCLGISLITNNIATDSGDEEDDEEDDEEEDEEELEDETVTHEKVLQMGQQRSQDLSRLISAFIDSVKDELGDD